MPFCNIKQDSVFLNVRIIPNASKNCILEKSEDCLKIRIKAPPVDNKANKTLICFLSKQLKLNKQKIIIKSGKTTKNKLIHIGNLTEAEIEKLKAFFENA